MRGCGRTRSRPGRRTVVSTAATAGPVDSAEKRKKGKAQAARAVGGLRAWTGQQSPRWVRICSMTPGCPMKAMKHEFDETYGKYASVSAGITWRLGKYGGPGVGQIPSCLQTRVKNIA